MLLIVQQHNCILSILRKTQNTEHSFVVGVDVGGTKILTGVFDANLQIVALKKTRTRAEIGPQLMLKDLAETINETLASVNVARSAVQAIGIGVPGLIGFDRQTVLLAPNLNWTNVNVREHLFSYLRIPVVAINDVEAGTIAVQKLGAGRSFRHFVCIFVGTGVGGGIVLDGRSFRGVDGLGGEIGHMAILPRNGPEKGSEMTHDVFCRCCQSPGHAAKASS